MKNKLITLIVFLVALVTCFACSSEKEVIENTDNKQNLQILKTDFKLTQEQTLSKIKAEYLLENNGYKDDDEIVIMVTLNAKPLIEIYNEQYLSSVKNVAEYAKSKDGLVQASIIKNEQDKLIINLLENKLIDSVKYRYNTIINAVAVNTTYGNFKKISELTNVKSTMLSDTFNLPKASTDASAIENPVDVYETGIYKSDSVNFTGKGTAVAILDSGFDCSHSVFQREIDTEMLTFEYIESILGDTNAASEGFYKGSQPLKVTDVYYSKKIPFVYDYADKDYDVFPYDSEHGTHVAGIIGGKDDTITGIAVDTQLVLMKVFPDLDEGGKTEDILAALEDSVKIGVDAINMSLGSSCGFAREEDNDQLNAVYDAIGNAGISLLCAASNSYSSSFGGAQGDTNFVTNPDSGTVGSPSTYDAALSVASISGTKSKYLIANNERVVFFTESNAMNGLPNDFYEELYKSLGKDKSETLTLEYVTVPGVGLGVNFTALGDLTGKVALIRRGDNTFEEKAKNAKAAGAVACIIYNNIEGNILMSMGKSDHIPTISISKELGTELAKKKSGTLTLSYQNQAGPFMSDFSSWGPTPSLGIKPEITAHGGNIKSSVPGGGYDELSGTSMATPNLCGIVVLIRQYLKEQFKDQNLTDKEISNLANQLLMSTSEIILNEQGNPYAVRKQGAGLASLYNAVNTKAYLTVDGIDRPKLELLDDPEKTGVYTMEFNVVNLTNTALKYNLGVIGMTESVSTSDEEHVAEKSLLLTDAFKAEVISGGTLNGKVVTVNANETCKIKVVYTLTKENKEYIENSFPYGMYVEGFVELKDINTLAENEKAIDLNIPFLAFYGDWTQAPIFDKTYYEVESEAHDLSIDEEDKLKADYFATTPYGSYYYNYIIPLGTYLYDIDTNNYDSIPASKEHIALSNYLGTIDGISAVYAGLLRNCKTMDFTIVDKQTGEVVYEHTDYNAQKSYYAGQALPYYDFLNLKSAELKLVNNRQYEFKMTGLLDYKDGGVKSNIRNTFSFDFYLDDEAPILNEVEYSKEYDKSLKKDRYYVTLSIYDNHYAQSITPIIFTSSSSYTFLTENPIPIYSEKGQTSKVKFEITDYLEDIYSDSIVTNALAFAIDDYALNSDIYICQLPGTDGDFKFTKDGTMEGTDLIILSMYENEAIDLTKYLATKDETVDVDKDYLKYLEWISSNEEVVEVKDGIVKGIKAGKATITARENLYGKQAVLIVNVKSRTTSNRVNKDETVSEDVNKTKIEEIRFSYFDTLFAYSRAAQTSEIGATGDRKYLSSLPGGVSMYPGESIQLSYDLDPWYAADNYELTYVSRNPSIAEVDQDGIVKGLKEGSTIIELRVKGSNLIATLNITIKSEFVIENRTLVAYKGLGGKVVIPDDEGILYIGAYAFCLYDTDNSVILTEEDYDANKIPLMNTSVTSVVIPDGVEEIQKYAFYNCSALESVTIPESIKFIREFAFYGNESLKTFDFKKTQAIGRDAFGNCVELKLEKDQFTKIYSMGARAFAGCTSLEYADLTALRNAGKEVFKDCTALETVVFGRHTKLSYAMFVNSGIKEANLYETIEIPEFCFAQCANLTKVVLNNSLIEIKNGAFSECTSLTEFTFKGSVDTIGEQVFYATNKLEKITLPNSKVKLGAYVFHECSELEEVHFQENTYLEDVLGTLFDGTNLTKFVVDTNNPYYSTNSEGNLLLNKDQTKIILAARAIDYNDLVIDSTITEIGNSAFAGSDVKTVTISNINTVIGDYAFANCEELTKVILPVNNNVTIKARSFYNDKNLLEVENLQFVKNVGSYAFASSGIKTANIADNAVYSEGVFYQAALENVTIGENAKFGFACFQECRSLVTVNMPENGGVHIGEQCFLNCVQLKTIDLSKTDETIEKYAFYNCQELLNAHLTNVKNIGDYAFSDCVKLLYVTLPVVENIGAGAFSRTSTYAGGGAIFTELLLPNTLKTIGDGAFLGCEKLVEIEIPSSVTSIGDYVFSYCLSLEEVVLPNTIDTIGEYTFAGCSMLNKINLENIKTFEMYSFISCVSLENVDLSNVEIIKEGAFADTEIKGDLSTPNLKEIENYGFQGAAITSIVAPNLEKIGYYAFQYNEHLVNFVFSNKLSSVGSAAFNGCTSLESFAYFAEEGTKTNGSINDYALLEKGNLYTYMENGKLQLTAVPQASNVTTLEVLEGTARIDFFAGNENKNVTRIVLPDSLEIIGNYAFYGYDSLKTVEFKSYRAPRLEDSYNNQAVLEEGDPGYDIIHNQYELFGLELCYYNFIDLVGKKESIEMVLPINTDLIGYDSLVYYIYFGSVEDAGHNNYLAKEENIIKFYEYAKEISSLEHIVIANEELVDNALKCYKAIKQDPTLFGYDMTEWNELVEKVESAKAEIKEIKIRNAKKAVREVNELLKTLPTVYSEEIKANLLNIQNKLNDLTLEEKALLDLTNYNNLYKAYEESLSTEPQLPGGDDKVEPSNNPWGLIIIISASVVVAGGIGVTLVIVLKKKGGKKDEENN